MSKRILAVDDSKTMRDMVAFTLRNAGFQVDEAEDGKVALNKLAQREKVLYVTGISGSNDTTGKDCVRYGFRQCFYGQTAAAAIGGTVVGDTALSLEEVFVSRIQG